MRGWHIEGTPPADRKFILVGAPHTSNWDFAVFLGATDDLGIHPSFIGKQSLFSWPMRRFMFDMGGIPVDRTRRSNYVEQVVAEFAKRDELALVIAPEGTRDSDGRWKSGFYHIAIGAAIRPTGDYAADLKRIAGFYRTREPDNPRFGQIDRDVRDIPGLPNG